MLTTIVGVGVVLRVDIIWRHIGRIEHVYRCNHKSAAAKVNTAGTTQLKGWTKRHFDDI